mgnify:CR=1 FL=1
MAFARGYKCRATNTSARGIAVATTCVVCGSDVPVSHAVHATINTKTDAGVVDHYVCQACYEDRLAPLFE